MWTHVLILVIHDTDDISKRKGRGYNCSSYPVDTTPSRGAKLHLVEVGVVKGREGILK